MLEKVVNKCLSARFLMTVMFSITGCWMAVKGTIPNEAFIGILTLIVNEYFKRTDRTQANGEKP